jgi:hypothetical protein
MNNGKPNFYRYPKTGFPAPHVTAEECVVCNPAEATRESAVPTATASGTSPPDTRTVGLPPRFIDRLTSLQRKQFPMATGLIDYAPDALAAVSHVSWVGNQKHNPGEPLHHARGKSMDHADCQIRHLSTRLDPDPAYAGDPIEEVSHLAQKAWRAIIELQERMEEVYGLGMAPGARNE